LTYPEVYLAMRRPIVEPEGERLEDGEILLRLADRMGLVPEIPNSLYQAARGNRAQFLGELMGYLTTTPGAMEAAPWVVAKTLGPVLGSAHLAAVWAMLQVAPESSQRNAARVGFHPGPGLGEEIFQALLDHPEGIWVGRCDPDKNLENLRTPDGKVNLYIDELAEWVQSIDATSEAAALDPDPSFPLVLSAGRHFDKNANTMMRDPAWNKKGHICTLLMHPSDAEALRLRDEQTVAVTTEAGTEIIELEVSEMACAGQVVMPHGFGLNYDGKVYGANCNRLTKNTHRDKLAATPLHRYVPCRVEAHSESAGPHRDAW